MSAQRRGFLAAGAVGLALSLIGWALSPRVFYPAWYTSLVFWLDVPLGALAFLLLAELTGGQWAALVRPRLVALSRILWLPALAMIPILPGFHWIWTGERSGHEAIYLRPGLVLARACVYLGSWVWLARLAARKRPLGQLAAGAGLVAYCLTSTLAAADGIMSLEPHWHSSIIGMIAWLRQGLAALTLAILLTPLESRHDDRSGKALRDLGNVLLALVMTWAYLSFMQLLVYWSGNLPEKATWFEKRSSFGWQWAISAVALFQVGFPILFLLFRATKRSAPALKGLAALLIACRVVETHWLVLPSIFPGELKLSWLNLCAFVALGGFVLAFARGREKAVVDG